jgi:mono/diheme cytochrome c family protein
VAVVVVLSVLSSARSEEAPPSYTKDIKPIMTTYCVNCHQPGKTKGGVDLTTYQGMFKGGKRSKTLIVAGKPDSSRLIQTMSGGRPAMPPRKSQQPTAREIATLKAWIAAGALEKPAAGKETEKTEATPTNKE